MIRSITAPLLMGSIIACAACSTPNGELDLPPFDMAGVPVPRAKPAPMIKPKALVSDFAGYRAPDAAAIFGAPSFARREGAVQAAQFRSATCILEMVFGAAGTAIHFEARALTGQPIDVQPCVDSLEQDSAAALAAKPLKKPADIPELAEPALQVPALRPPASSF